MSTKAPPGIAELDKAIADFDGQVAALTMPLFDIGFSGSEREAPRAIPVYHTLNIFVKGGLAELWQREKDFLIASDQTLSPLRAGVDAAAKLMYDAEQEMGAIEAYVRQNDVQAVNDLYDAWVERSERKTIAGELIDLSGSRTLLEDTDRLRHPERYHEARGQLWGIRVSPPATADYALNARLQAHYTSIAEEGQRLWASVPTGQRMAKPIGGTQSVSHRINELWDLLLRDEKSRLQHAKPLLRREDIDRIHSQLAAFHAWGLQKQDNPERAYADAITEPEYPDAPYGRALVADAQGQPVRPTAVLGTTEDGQKCIADVPLPGESLAEWVSGIGGAPGIVVDPGLARSSTCTRIALGEGHKALVYSPGVIGSLDEEQQALYCEAGSIDREASPAQKAHLQAMSEAAKMCSLESHDEKDPRTQVEAYFSCLGRELARREAKAT